MRLQATQTTAFKKLAIFFIAFFCIFFLNNKEVKAINYITIESVAFNDSNAEFVNIDTTINYQTFNSLNILNITGFGLTSPNFTSAGDIVTGCITANENSATCLSDIVTSIRQAGWFYFYFNNLFIPTANTTYALKFTSTSTNAFISGSTSADSYSNGRASYYYIPTSTFFPFTQDYYFRILTEYVCPICQSTATSTPFIEKISYNETTNSTTTGSTTVSITLGEYNIPFFLYIFIYSILIIILYLTFYYLKR